MDDQTIQEIVIIKQSYNNVQRATTMIAHFFACPLPFAWRTGRCCNECTLVGCNRCVCVCVCVWGDKGYVAVYCGVSSDHGRLIHQIKPDVSDVS